MFKCKSCGRQFGANTPEACPDCGRKTGDQKSTLEIISIFLAYSLTDALGCLIWILAALGAAVLIYKLF